MNLIRPQKMIEVNYSKNNENYQQSENGINNQLQTEQKIEGKQHLHRACKEETL